MELFTTSDWRPSSDGQEAVRVPRRGRLSRWAFLPGAIAAALLVSFARAQSTASGLRTDVVFTEYSPLCSTAELVRRLLSPLTAIRLNQEAERAGEDFERASRSIWPGSAIRSISPPALTRPQAPTHYWCCPALAKGVKYRVIGSPSWIVTTQFW